MQRKLIIISGRTGAGKTTFAKATCSKTSLTVEYLPTYTTRKERAGDYGYIYINKEEYDRLRGNASLWDHTEAHNEMYGTDIDEAMKKLGEGTNLICTCFPSLDEIHKIKTLYPVETVTIFIDIKRDISLERVNTERSKAELKRVEMEDKYINEELLGSFDYIFKPKGDLETDIPKFLELITSIVVEVKDVAKIEHSP